jgi:GGDEF domain-containing protein
VSDTSGQAYYLGSVDKVRGQLEEALGVQLQVGFPAAGGDHGDVLFMEAFTDPNRWGEVPGGNVFSACRALKNRYHIAVYLLVREGDDITPEIARFCLADGCLAVVNEGLVADPAEVRERLGPHRRPVEVDKLLTRLEQEIASDSGRQASALQRMLVEADEETLLDHLVDRETGLFDGPFASFKLDEEFKRASRFHQPLSLMLIEPLAEPLDQINEPGDRRVLLADISSVFLNECRDIDVLARFTENVFMVLMPGTGAGGARVLTNRVLSELRGREFIGGRRLKPIAGLATMPAAGVQRRQEFLARVEACLQLAREGKGERGLCAYSE